MTHRILINAITAIIKQSVLLIIYPLFLHIHSYSYIHIYKHNVTFVAKYNYILGFISIMFHYSKYAFIV